MTASRSARERRAAAQTGPLAVVRIDVGADGSFVYTIACTACEVRGGRRWSAYRPGGDNGFMAAMDRWTFHLVERHPDREAPCLAFLDDARARLQERRERREATASGTDAG